jgi:hypothetical protein
MVDRQIYRRWGDRYGNYPIAPQTRDQRLQHLKMDRCERAVCDDLSRLKAEDQHAYYLETCEDLGLDPATFPLRWIVADGRLALAVETCVRRKDSAELALQRDA